MSEENKMLIRRWIEEGLNKRNMTLVGELLDPGYVYHGVVEGDIIGVEAMKQFLTWLYAAFPDDQHMIQEQVAEGDKVVTRWSFTGTHQGELMGLAPTGKQVKTSGMVIDRIVEGKIVEEREEWDALGMMQQLGAVPPIAKAEDKAAAQRNGE
jgi:steroid delta-isomerase-like uncharacterized protein